MQPNTSSNFQILHVFEGQRNGIVPVGALLAVDGAIYGTTNFGGDPSKKCYPANGCGTVYAMNSSNEVSVLFRFHGATGTRPYSGVIDVNGTLYGTTQTGGKHNEGTVYAMSPSGVENVVWSFKGKNGDDPRAGLTAVDGTIYGTTYYGGAAGLGTVFALSTSGAEKVLHSFTGDDGELPLGALISVDGVLYGTTSSGGANNKGDVFSIQPASGQYTVLYSFAGGNDGAYPFAGLTEFNGALYGTTELGGAYNGGTVFAITPTGVESVLHSFGHGTDGSRPYAGLTVLNGQLYGTTAYGGTSGTSLSLHASGSTKPTSEGTIFTITPSGLEQVVHDFSGGPGGRVPYANLTAVNNALFGTTIWGGNAQGPKGGTGTLFEFTP